MSEICAKFYPDLFLEFCGYLSKDKVTKPNLTTIRNEWHRRLYDNPTILIVALTHVELYDILKEFVFCPRICFLHL
jgi:hypothetical protein